MDKNEIRANYLNLRNNLSQNEIIKKSKIITEKILKLPDFLDCQTVFIYHSVGSEVITTDIINYCFEIKKRVCLPVAEKGNTMYFVEVKNLDNLKKNKLNILEPIGNEVKSDESTLIIVPGIAFDKYKNRIGYGAGFYDDYLSKNVYKNAVGLFFKVQETAYITANKFDIKLNYIITE